MPDNRPTGNVPASGPAVPLDLEVAADRLTAKLVGSNRQAENLARHGSVSVVMMAMEAGDALDEHAADGVVLVQLLRGQAVLRAGDEEFTLHSGQLVMMQPNLRHDLRAETQSVVLLTIAEGAK